MTTAANQTKINSTYTEMTPYNVYLLQIRATVDTVRAAAIGYSYMPPQLGGLSGQLKASNDALVLQTLDFKIGSKN